MAETSKEALKSDEIRRRVSEAYRTALERSQSSGGGSCCCGPSEPVVPAGTAAKTAGYADELAAFPEAGQSSFGCGNPLALAGVEAGQTVLDLGSGAGLDLLIASEMVGPEGLVIGVDMTEEMLATARANAERSGRANVELRRGQIEDLPLESDSVDWVISNCVVNLSPEKERVFAEIQRVLKPGGRFSISDIVAQDLPRDILESFEAYACCIAGAISEEAYLAGLRAAGLTEVRVEERFVYDAEQLAALVASEGGEGNEGIAPVVGKVASLRFTGAKAG